MTRSHQYCSTLHHAITLNPLPQSNPIQSHRLLFRLRLASLVSYIPLPVVAGYLGYVGYFCCAAGAAQGTGQDIASLSSWMLLFHYESILKTLATAAATLFIFFGLRCASCRHHASLCTNVANIIRHIALGGSYLVQEAQARTSRRCCLGCCCSTARAFSRRCARSSIGFNHTQLIVPHTEKKTVD